jgi:AAA family ATP:ADP antiporter
MAMNYVIEKLGAALGIKRGEFITAFSLFCYLLLVIASYIISKTVRDALFLTEFGALNLPYVYIGIAIFVSLFVAIYIRAGHHVRPHLLVSGTLLFFLSNVVLFWWLLRLGSSWLYPVVYIWVGIFGVIAPMQVWTLSSLFLTTRQAKRLYGFIGSGGLLGAIAGGLFSSWMVTRVGTENLLLSLVVFLAVCIGLANVIWFQAATENEQADPEQLPRSWLQVSTLIPVTRITKEEEPPGSLRQSLCLIIRSRYLLLITSIISIGAIATTIADYLFKTVSQEAFAHKDQLTAFFGSFYGYLGIGAVLLQLLLTSRLMRKFGIGLTIFLLPASLILGSAALLTFVSLWSAALLKGIDQLFKHSVDKSTIEILYLPVPDRIRTAVKSFIDTVVWRLADAVAGLLLLFLTSIASLSVRQISLVNLCLLFGWVVIAYRARRRYVDALRSTIFSEVDAAQPRPAESELLHDTGSLIKALQSPNPDDVIRSLELIDSTRDKQKFIPHLEHLLHHGAPEVRAKVLTLLFDSGNERLVEKVKGLVNDASPEVQAVAIQFIFAYGEKEIRQTIQSFSADFDYQIKVAAISGLLTQQNNGQYCDLARDFLNELLSSSEARVRREAARLLGLIKRPSPFHSHLARLLQDSSPEVVAQALHSAGVVQRLDFVPLIIPHLGRKESAPLARNALVRYGNKVLGTLRDYLVSEEINFEVRKAIPSIFTQIKTQEAVDILTSSLNLKHPRLRLAILKALNKLRAQALPLQFPAARIRRQLINETKDYYATLIELHQAAAYEPVAVSASSAPPQMLRPLADNLDTVLERIFRLLGLIYPPHDLHQAYRGLLSQNPTIRANSLEFLDNLLEADDREWLLPIVDEELPLRDRLAAAKAVSNSRRSRKLRALARLFGDRSQTLAHSTFD